MSIDIPRLVLVVLALSVGGVFVLGGVTSTAAFSAFNPDWDGTNTLRETAEMAGSEPTVLSETAQYETYGANETVFILAPTENYTSTDIGRIESFLDRGGTLVIAVRDDDPGRTLLADLDAEARPVGPILRDEREYYRNPSLPVVTPRADHPLVRDVPSVTLNYGTAIEPGGATPILATSEYAYLDRDGNEELSETESVSSYPVATVERIGEGRVVTVGDPSVFINVMQERDGNRAFTVALTNGTDRTVIDVSRKDDTPPLIGLLLLIRNSAWLQLGLGIAVFGCIGGWRRYSSLNR